jgi:hypothetical protein
MGPGLLLGDVLWVWLLQYICNNGRGAPNPFGCRGAGNVY